MEYFIIGIIVITLAVFIFLFCKRSMLEAKPSNSTIKNQNTKFNNGLPLASEMNE